MTDISVIEIKWEGPFSWPKFENKSNLSPVPKVPGVYLQTFEHKNGYLIYCAGLTRRPIINRFKEHTKKYMNGEYNVLDISAARQGTRKEIWHGWDYARNHRSEFEEGKSMILNAVEEQLGGFRLFITNMEAPRILERLEASIMNNLYEQLPPICDIPDRGMQLSPRWESEDRIILKNDCPAIIYGLPSCLEI